MQLRPLQHRACSISVVLLCLLALGGLSGCAHTADAGSGGSGGGGGSAPDPYANLSGNWQITATASNQSPPFSSLSGFVNQLAVNATAQATSAALLVTSTGCYATAPVVPLSGNVQQASVSLTSFAVDAQVLTLKATTNLAGDSLTGTYSIAGGCADGATGTISGSRYAALTGTYQGSLTSDATKQLRLQLSQYIQGTGGGTFLVTGSASITGLSCFTTGSLSANGAGYVSGKNAVLAFTTSDPAGAQLVLNGTFDAAASALSLTSVQVTAGSCAGSYGTATLQQGS